MPAAHRLDPERLLQAETDHAFAATALRDTPRSASVFLVIVIVGGMAATGALLGAARGVPPSSAVVGAVAGGAFGLASVAFGEVRRLSRRIAAMQVIGRGDGD